MMKPSRIASTLLTALALGACSDNQTETTETAGANAAAPAAAAASNDGSSAEWTVPRTAWGDPDLQGMWPLESVSGTPMQRDPALGDQAVWTDEQYEERVRQQAVAAEAYDREDAANRIGTGHWFERTAAPLRQTSLITEPANGRIPPMTEAGLARAANMKSSWSEEVFESIDDFNPLDRCITRGLPASMVPFPYNNGLEIFQSPGYVVLNLELVHETRIIPVDGTPHLDAAIRPWLGDSRGHWEGDTLVVETTNFNGLSPMVIVGPSNEPIPTSTEMRIVERFTLTGPDTLYYEAEVEDPVVITGPWKMEFPLTRDESYEVFEYACHEGNTVVEAYIKATSPRFFGDPVEETE